MPQDAPDAYLATLVQDINACASDALDALREGRLADVRTQLQAILDAVGDLRHRGADDDPIRDGTTGRCLTCL